VIDALRGFLNRPLVDADRPRLFAAAVAVILGGAAAFAVLSDRPSQRPAPHRAAPPSSLPAPAAQRPPVASLPAVAPAPEVPSEEGRPSAAATGLPADVRAARRAARRFLAGYLPFTYGRRSARASPRPRPGCDGDWPPSVRASHHGSVTVACAWCSCTPTASVTPARR
jgi:hypothetical protein